MISKFKNREKNAEKGKMNSKVKSCEETEFITNVIKILQPIE